MKVIALLGLSLLTGFHRTASARSGPMDTAVLEVLLPNTNPGGEAEPPMNEERILELGDSYVVEVETSSSSGGVSGSVLTRDEGSFADPLEWMMQMFAAAPPIHLKLNHWSLPPQGLKAPTEDELNKVLRASGLSEIFVSAALLELLECYDEVTLTMGVLWAAGMKATHVIETTDKPHSSIVVKLANGEERLITIENGKFTVTKIVPADAPRGFVRKTVVIGDDLNPSTSPFLSTHQGRLDDIKAALRKGPGILIDEMKNELTFTKAPVGSIAVPIPTPDVHAEIEVHFPRGADNFPLFFNDPLRPGEKFASVPTGRTRSHFVPMDAGIRTLYVTWNGIVDALKYSFRVYRHKKVRVFLDRDPVAHDRP